MSTEIKEFTYEDVKTHDSKNVCCPSLLLPFLPSFNAEGEAVLFNASLFLSVDVFLTRLVVLQDLWVVVNDKVYDITKFVDEHPYVSPS